MAAFVPLRGVLVPDRRVIRRAPTSSRVRSPLLPTLPPYRRAHATMLVGNALGGFGAGPPDIYTGNLKCHLDVGNRDCVAVSSDQTLVDLTGNALNYFRGADGTATTDDPAFNGTPGGLSGAEYLSYDGGDKNKSTGTQTGTIGRRLGSSQQSGSVEIWWYAGATGANYALWANMNTGAGKGLLLWATSADKIKVDINPTVGTSITSAATLTSGTWRQAVVTAIPDNTANGVKLYINGALDAQATANNTGFTTGDSEVQPEFMSDLAGLSVPPNGSRFAMIRHYDAILTAEQVLQNYEARRGRYPA